MYDRFVSLITGKGRERGVIKLPENAFNEGWELLADKINSFTNKDPTTTKVFTYTREVAHATNREKGRYKKMLGKKNKWTQKETKASTEMIDVAGEEVIKAKAHLADADLLSRCLVGHFSSKGDAPTRSDVRRCAHRTWKGAQGVLIYDMNRVTFLFEFQSRKEVEHVLIGEWRRQGDHLN